MILRGYQIGRKVSFWRILTQSGLLLHVGQFFVIFVDFFVCFVFKIFNYLVLCLRDDCFS